jgi:hypothetical protein
MKTLTAAAMKNHHLNRPNSVKENGKRNELPPPTFSLTEGRT